MVYHGKHKQKGPECCCFGGENDYLNKVLYAQILIELQHQLGYLGFHKNKILTL